MNEKIRSLASSLTPHPSNVDLIVNDILAPEDIVLQNIRANCRATRLPTIEVSAQQGKMLQMLAHGKEFALEIGTLGGYSTVCIARGMHHAGMVVTIDYEPHHLSVARANFRMANLNHRITTREGDALKILATLHGCAFDFVFIDADKENNGAYLQWAVDWCPANATIIVDNVIRSGRVLDPLRADKLEFIDLVGTLIRKNRIEASVVQTVGAKGWDGFVLARKI